MANGTSDKAVMQRQAQAGVAMIEEAFEDQRAQLGTVRFYGMLAEKLSMVVGKDPAWTWRYVQGVGSGKIGASEVFARAVQGLGAQLDGTPGALADVQGVQVLARPGTIVEGAVVLGKAKPCGRPGCRVWFVPRVPWQKYPSPKCRRKGGCGEDHEGQ